ncbi:MAG: DUF434 domain-containing protein [Sedimentisphaerales bacterium]|jgi:hypothetical protein
MPDKRIHRGQHPADEKLFSETWIPNIRRAVTDYSLLLSKRYAEKSSLKLVGDRFTLTERQRLAVMRSACSDEQQAGRKSRQLDINAVAGQMIAIDGYNLLITIEAAMSGGLIFRGRDGCCRDLASIHGTYRRVSETQPAIELMGGFLQQIGTSQALWLLDSPVSNSGRLKTLLRELAEKSNWKWEIELVTSPDAVLIKSEKIVASSDSVVLDKCGKWVDLAGEIIKKRIPAAKIIDLETQP